MCRGGGILLVSIPLVGLVVLCSKYDDESHSKDAEDAEHGGQYGVSEPTSHFLLLEHRLTNFIMTCGMQLDYSITTIVHRSSLLSFCAVIPLTKLMIVVMDV